MNGSPCNGCTKRTTGCTTVSCHASCKEYKDWRRIMDEAERKKSVDRGFDEYMFGTHLHVHTQKPKEW